MNLYRLFHLVGQLDGTVDIDSLNYKHNNRSYVSEGVQVNATFALENHTVEVGIRSHEDSMDRYQPQDYYSQTNGTYAYTSTKAPSGSNNRVEKAEASAFSTLLLLPLGAFVLVYA